MLVFQAEKRGRFGINKSIPFRDNPALNNCTEVYLFNAGFLHK
jgi:hypothetical protein